MNFIKNRTLIFFLLASAMFPRDMNYLDVEIIVNNDPYPANMFIHTIGSQPRYMAIIDSLINPSWFINSGPLGLDFKVNQNKLSYFNNNHKSWIILNEYMNETDTLECVNGYLADFHDILLLENGGYLLQTYDSIYVDMSQIDPDGNTNALIILLIIQEFDSDKNLIFEWNAWEHLNIADYDNLDLTANRIVWMHGNSIHIDLDSNILISNRRSSEVIKINRNNGDVIWIFGGPNNEFSITNDAYNGFSRQHDVRRIDNGNILLFDNGNDHDPPISRAVEYEIDESGMTANLVWEFSHPEGYVGLAMGSVQRLPNNNTLINWGSLSDQGAVITEVNYDNNIVLEIQYPNPIRCYRVRKHHWKFDTNLIPGDTNLDDKIDILDINLIADFAAQDTSELDVYHLYRYDINRDRSIDNDDINLLAQMILGF